MREFKYGYAISNPQIRYTVANVRPPSGQYLCGQRNRGVGILGNVKSKGVKPT